MKRMIEVEWEAAGAFVDYDPDRYPDHEIGVIQLTPPNYTPGQPLIELRLPVNLYKRISAELGFDDVTPQEKLEAAHHYAQALQEELERVHDQRFDLMNEAIRC